MGGGDYEEHAVLLANYFQYIDDKKNTGYKSYICLGTGMPNGPMVFVIRKQNNAAGSFELWDPLAAQCYYFELKTERNTFWGIPIGKSSHLDIRLQDPICPLIQIHTVVSSENVWVNVQRSDYPVLMDFDLTKPKCWKKFFEPDKVQVPIQGLDIIYAPKKE